jgi:hypothetical protein
VIINGVCIGNRIYRTLTELVTMCNYNRFLNSHISQFTIACEKSYVSPVGVTTQRLPTMGTPMPPTPPPGATDSTSNSYSYWYMCVQTESQSQDQSYFTTGGLPPISSSWRQASWDSLLEIFLAYGHSPYVTISLSWRWVCLLWICLGFRQVHVPYVIDYPFFCTIYEGKSIS